MLKTFILKLRIIYLQFKLQIGRLPNHKDCFENLLIMYEFAELFDGVKIISNPCRYAGMIQRYLKWVLMM